ncbi:Uncharacterised protein [Acinetobacter baumannii]|uniref:hypothetical protein n=1 Tax=Acinetobacter baumannii TaxID=470 RepID=UPI0004469977|nr:hypothetical protein [Acinetobacter baumannii]EXB99044.1 hypothetical protein J539_2649 [Acinetobacter baumannii 342950]MCG5791639.1 hypothetical protein [Acinetobacter baumannii]MDA4916892.1 hypothetical protein [Acinetobacter baumannii]MDC4259824.1 hypothetical protein [Acinetobacter baumannii]MDC5565398.1 hypothetical protein [Acinetobacter baumannii]
MDTQELKTLIPLLAPFLTVFLGILAIPFIEVYKNYIEKKRLLNSLLEELKDEVKNLQKEYDDLFPCYVNALKIKSDEEGTNYNVVVPVSIVLYSEEKLLNNHFQNLDQNVRQTLKSINSLIEPLNLITEKLHDLYHDAYQDKDINNLKLQKLIDLLGGYLCNMLFLRYNMNYLIDLLLKKNSNLKIHYEIDFKDAIHQQLHEMNKLHHYSFLMSRSE